MTLNRILLNLLNVKGAVVDGAEFGCDGPLTVHVHVRKGERWRCPVCGRRCGVYDGGDDEVFWRSMDFGPVPVRIGAKVPRVRCPEHGVHAARVPWAKPGSRFTTDFAYSVAWMVKGGLSRKRVSEWLGIDWKTVGRLIDLVWKDLEPDPKRRYDGLVKIGIDETSYRKGHKYITVVVNHETNTVVWAHEGYGKEVLGLFFNELTKEQRESIRLVSGDGARYITDAVAKFCPNATRCLDPFHAVEWVNDALGSIRIDAWHRARAAVVEMERALKTSANPGDKTEKEKIRQARKTADEIKGSKYALGKNPENLTPKQTERLALVQAEDPKLRRGHEMKESLRLVFKLSDPELAEAALDRWLARAQRCRIPAFVELGRKIRRHKANILNTVRHGLSNARVEATNNKIKLLVRIAYGFRDVNAMIGMILLFCSSLEIPWPGRTMKKPVKQGDPIAQTA